MDTGAWGPARGTAGPVATRAPRHGVPDPAEVHGRWVRAARPTRPRRAHHRPAGRFPPFMRPSRPRSQRPVAGGAAAPSRVTGPVVRGTDVRPRTKGAANPQRAGHRSEQGHRAGGAGCGRPATDEGSREPAAGGPPFRAGPPGRWSGVRTSGHGRTGPRTQAGAGTVGPGGCDDAPEGRQRAALRRYLGAHRPARGVRSAPARRTQFDRADGRHAWPGALPSGGPPCLLRGSGPTAPRAQQAGGSPPLTRPPKGSPTVSAGGSTVPRGCVPGCGGGPGPVPWWRGPYAVRCRGPS